MKKLNSKVRILILIGVLVISALTLMSNARVNAQTTDLTSLNEGDAMAYHWKAMGRFYRDQAASLTSPDADDAMAYRWEAMGRFYRDQGAKSADLPWEAAARIALRDDITAYHLSERADYGLVSK